MNTVESLEDEIQRLETLKEICEDEIRDCHVTIYDNEKEIADYDSRIQSLRTALDVLKSKITETKKENAVS